MLPAANSPNRKKPFRVPPAAARDLSDFQARWHEFRPSALDVYASFSLTADEAETINWLIELADKLCVEDPLAKFRLPEVVA